MSFGKINMSSVVGVTPDVSLLESIRFIFVNDSYGSTTSLMKVYLPLSSIIFWGGSAKFFALDDFITSYIDKKTYQSNDVIILTKTKPYLNDHFIENLAKIKDKVSFIFSETSEESSFSCFLQADVFGEKLEILSSLIDGFLYETDDLQSLIHSVCPDAATFFTRHIHSNCHSMFSPASPISDEIPTNSHHLPRSPERQQEILDIAYLQHFKSIETIGNIGYMGRPKYCHNYDALNRCSYTLSHKLKNSVMFMSSNPGIQSNFHDTLSIDFGFSLIDKCEASKSYYNYKTGNKVTGLWSLGIPGLFSPLPSYKKIFEENNIDFSDWSFPEEFAGAERSRANTRLFGDAIAEKIYEISSNDFEEKRLSLFAASKRYNPVNIAWLYEEVFQFIKKSL
tara:strand:+ start:453 stop:1637 length:1185 start_codon:yes stop_codon:yes gene_type:complete